MVDLTDVKALFGIVTFKVAVVFDAFSRMPLSARVFMKEPSSAEIARFVSGAAKKRGRPAHFVSDRGACFTGGVFCHKLRRLGVKQRFGAIGKKGSIAMRWRPVEVAAIPSPRGRPGEGPTNLPFRIDYLDAERLLPVLVRKAA